MIRDPSDGSVKGINPSSNDINEVHAKTPPEEITSPVIATTTSGLPAASAKDADRHKRSKEWLEQYHIDPESVPHLNSKPGEHE